MKGCVSLTTAAMTIGKKNIFTVITATVANRKKFFIG